jgi:hypothetical protein
MPSLRLAAGALLAVTLLRPAAAHAQAPTTPSPSAQPPAAPAPAEPAPTATAPATPPGAAQMEMRHEHASGWAELDAFHAAMAAAWHPAERGDDLAPARARAGELAQRADAWAASRAPASVPASCRAASTTPLVRAVAREARAFARASARPGASDAQLKAALRGVHDRFHAVEGRCGGMRGNGMRGNGMRGAGAHRPGTGGHQH